MASAEGEGWQSRWVQVNVPVWALTWVPRAGHGNVHAVPVPANNDEGDDPRIEEIDIVDPASDDEIVQAHSMEIGVGIPPATFRQPRPQGSIDQGTAVWMSGGAALIACLVGLLISSGDPTANTPAHVTTLIWLLVAVVSLKVRHDWIPVLYAFALIFDGMCHGITLLMMPIELSAVYLSGPGGILAMPFTFLCIGILQCSLHVFLLADAGLWMRLGTVLSYVFAYGILQPPVVYYLHGVEVAGSVLYGASFPLIAPLAPAYLVMFGVLWCLEWHQSVVAARELQQQQASRPVQHADAAMQTSPLPSEGGRSASNTDDEDLSGLMASVAPFNNHTDDSSVDSDVEYHVPRVA